jgi:hypothetical protein
VEREGPILGDVRDHDSTEPRPRSYGKDIGENPADPGDGALYRTVHALAVNNTITPNPTTVAHVRFGYTSFADDCVPVDFDPGTLGFSSSYVGQVPQKKFPYIGIGGYGTAYNGVMFGDRGAIDSTYYSYDANASMSKLWGRHTVKFGASYRKIGLKEFAANQTSGEFYFDGQFTGGPDPLNATTGDPHALAAFLLGIPSDGGIPVATQNDFFIDYYAGYAQDDFRINPDLTVNFGLRYEFEQGLQEKSDAFTVGFDRDRACSSSPGRLSSRRPAHAGSTVRHTRPLQGEFAPRVGFAWINPTVPGGAAACSGALSVRVPSEEQPGRPQFHPDHGLRESTDGPTPCPTCSIVNASRTASADRQQQRPRPAPAEPEFVTPSPTSLVLVDLPARAARHLVADRLHWIPHRADRRERQRFQASASIARPRFRR